MRECVKHGSDYAPLSGGKVYTLKRLVKELDKYAGTSVTVREKLSGNTFTGPISRLSTRCRSQSEPLPYI
jgi:hypothetical protein